MGSRRKNGDAVDKEYIKPRPPVNFLPFGPKVCYTKTILVSEVHYEPI